jgi:hypothetical protein
MKAVSLSFFLRTKAKNRRRPVTFLLTGMAQGAYIACMHDSRLRAREKADTMTIRIGQWEFELGLRRVRPLVGGNLDLQADLAAAYAKIGRPRRRKRAANAPSS